MAKKIETATDVVEWAKSVVEAKGEKFTALSKGEQYEIAKYVCEVSQKEMEGNTALASVQGAELNEEKDFFVTGDCTGKSEEESRHLPSSEPPTSDENLFPQVPTATTVTMTRGYVYHQMGLDAQQTFDKFLSWGKDHPKELSVMDFSTGRKSTDAAFAYWLNEIMPVNIPHKVR